MLYGVPEGRPYDFYQLPDCKFGIVGATGVVGKEILKILEENNVPIQNISLFASKRSIGKKVAYKDEELIVKKMDIASFGSIDIVFFAVGSDVSKKYARACADRECVVIDNSSAFRLENRVPLVIPEINIGDINGHTGLIANPNCSTIIMLMAVYPIHIRFPIKRIVVSTYQAASGAGYPGMRELSRATEYALRGEDFQPYYFQYDYAFNLFSHDSKVSPSGYNEEEIKMIRETRKILHQPDMEVAPTCIRVPVLRAHSESIHLEFKGAAPTMETAIECLNNFPGIKLVDDRENNHFPMPSEASGKYECLVGRLRHDLYRPNERMELFVVGDQLLKGAALNAVQIASEISNAVPARMF